MRLAATDDERAFRSELRAWLEAVVPSLPPEPTIEDWDGRRARDTRWQRLVHDAGYAGLDWPVEAGGRGASPVEHLIFLEECERAHAPYGTANYVGLNHAGPTIIAEGTPEQRARFLPPILRGDHVWCQGFSEPGAGSDLASLRTRAVRDGDHYRVTGHKIWTSHAPVADYCELLVRTSTDEPRHRAISWLILPMDSPGITIRPLRTLMGSADFAEVHLDDVPVPVSHRVGSENDGWRVAMVTLAYERGTAFANEILASRQLVRELAALAQEPRGRTGQVPWTDDELRRRIGRHAAELDGLWALLLGNVGAAAAGNDPAVGASVLKLRFTELRQELFHTRTQMLGRGAAALHGVEGEPGSEAVLERLRGLSLTIAGGTSEIQRNIIATRAMGLPRGA